MPDTRREANGGIARRVNQSVAFRRLRFGGSKFQANGPNWGDALALSARLEIRQGQGLVITPQLQQAIKLLQLSNLELEAFVEAELERNPLLARDEGEPEPDGEPAAEPAEASADRIDDADARAEFD